MSLLAFLLSILNIESLATTVLGFLGGGFITHFLSKKKFNEEVAAQKIQNDITLSKAWQEQAAGLRQELLLAKQDFLDKHTENSKKIEILSEENVKLKAQVFSLGIEIEVLRKENSILKKKPIKNESRSN